VPFSTFDNYQPKCEHFVHNKDIVVEFVLSANDRVDETIVKWSI